MVAKKAKAKAPTKAKAKAPTKAKAKAPTKAKAKAPTISQADLWRDLSPVANEINAMLENAMKADTRAVDLRLSAACKLEDARKQCDAAKLSFRKWCDDNVKQSYETVRKLVRVGASDNPRQALLEMRQGEAARARKSRVNKKAQANGAAPRSAGRTTTKRQPAAPAPLATEPTIVNRAARAMDEPHRLALAKDLAVSTGMQLVTEAMAKKAKLGERVTLAEVKSEINGLSAIDRRALLVWLTDVCERESADALGIPAEFKRSR